MLKTQVNKTHTHTCLYKTNETITNIEQKHNSKTEQKKPTEGTYCVASIALVKDGVRGGWSGCSLGRTYTECGVKTCVSVR